MKILVVDDSKLARVSLVKSIRALEPSAEIIEAENGLIGVQKFEEENPRVVFMDLTMPVMNGLSALRGIRRKDPGAVVVMCSALGQQEYVIRAIQLGAKDFIVKPFRAERIVNAVRRAAIAR